MDRETSTPRCISCGHPFESDSDRYPRFPGDFLSLCGACAGRLRAAGSFAAWLDAEDLRRTPVPGVH